MGLMADRGTQAGGSAGGRGLPLGAGSQTLKGALLVGAAVVLGIVLLQVVDDGTAGPVSAARKPAATTSTTHTTTSTSGKTTTTTKTTKPVKKPAQIKLLVLNAGAPTGSAGTVSTTLRGKGYTNQGKAANDPNHRAGTAVLCRAGLSREAATLAVLLGTGTTKGSLSNPAPPGSTGYDCVVLVGT
jgi:LytR cell envelope-related transcriptional attenuator